MQVHDLPIFRRWVPEWLARAVIFSVLLTSLLGFALYLSNGESATGYYGIAPTDLQYSVVLMYAAAVAFLALDFRIVKYFTARKYLLFGLGLNALSYLICFYSGNWGIFLICRFAQGTVSALLWSIVLNMVFPRLHATRSRVIGYTVFYAGLQLSIPLCAIYCSSILHFFNFNWLFYGLNLMIIPVIFAVLLTMNTGARFQKKIPLYQVDWIGYIFYTAFCVVTGYILVYGQQLGWFDNRLFTHLFLADMLLLTLFIIREIKLKRPLIDFSPFKSRNFITGLLLFFAYYTFKGTSGFTYGYIESVLGVDPVHVIPIWGANILGICLSMAVTARFILMGKSLKRIIINGFVMLALFYIYMLASISVTGETRNFIFPMFFYGVATGVLFVPIAVYTISTVPPKIAFNASFLGIFMRYIGFCASLAINNYAQLYTRSAVREKFRESLNDINPQVALTLKSIQNTFAYSGNDPSGKTGAGAYFDAIIKEQILARSVRDYYDIMLIGLVVLIILLSFLPAIRNVVLKISTNWMP